MNDAVRDIDPAPRATVLIVEAEQSVRSVTRRMLERCGFRSLVARDGGEARALADGRLGEITGLVLDLGMPDADAEELVRSLRSARSDLPVLFTGSCREAAAAVRLVGVGKTDFLPKPFGLEALGEKARHLFGGGDSGASGIAEPAVPLRGPRI